MDNLRQDWQDSNVSLGHESDIYESIINGKRKTALDALIKRYRWFSNSALILLAAVPCTFLNSRIFPDLKGRVTLVIIFSCYFLMASVMDRWLCQGVKSIDVARMPVVEVARKALYYKKWHLRFVLILLPMAFAILGFLAWGVGDTYLRIGMFCGFCFGIAMGTRQLLAFLADYRTLTSDLE